MIEEKQFKDEMINSKLEREKTKKYDSFKNHYMIYLKMIVLFI